MKLDLEVLPPLFMLSVRTRSIIVITYNIPQQCLLYVALLAAATTALQLALPSLGLGSGRT